MGGDRRREWSEFDDHELLEAWRAGDRAAGEELFERHYKGIAQFFHNKVSEPARDDLTQKTFLACLTSVANFRRESRFRTFLFGIANNVLMDYIKGLKTRMARLGSETDVDETPDESVGQSPVATVEQQQEHRVLLEALRRIPLIHQIALKLHYWEDLTAAEIGDVLGVPLGTAKTRLRDGRVYLKQQLRQLYSSHEALRDTTDDLDRWARRIRAQTPPGSREEDLTDPDLEPGPAPEPDPELELESDPEPDPELELELELEPDSDLDDL